LDRCFCCFGQRSLGGLEISLGLFQRGLFGLELGLFDLESLLCRLECGLSHDGTSQELRDTCQRVGSLLGGFVFFFFC
jgi:hypothetical protein